MSSRGALIFVSLALLDFGRVQAQNDTTNTTAPATPKFNSILKYEPSVPGNLIFGVLYAVLGLMFFYHVFKHSDRWAICLPIGATASAIGYFLKLKLDPHDLKLMLYILQNGLVVIAPSAFLAFNYMLYGRFITAIDPKFDFSNNKAGSKREKSRFSFIPPLIVGRAFVWSDVTTFLVQVAAGGMQAAGSKSPSLSNLGNKLFLIGVTIQCISYCLFTILLAVATHRLIADRRKAHSVSSEKTWMGLEKQTAVVVSGLFLSSIFIIVRSVYRIVEFTEGYDGYLATHEVYMFAFDAAPLVIAIGVFAFVWPPALLQRIAAQTREAQHSYAMENGAASTQTGNTSAWVPLV